MPARPSAPTALPDPRETAKTRARLIDSFGTDGDLLSLGVAIARVVEMTSSEDEATQNITYYVLADVGLTQKILRLANTVFYRSATNAPVTTISRAIFLLGLDTIKTTALALLLVDNLANSEHAEAIRSELVEALCASLIGRELARQSSLQGAEEASIAALFHNLGRMLMASHEHALYEQIGALTTLTDNPVQAAIQTMGCSYEFLTETVLRSWNFSELLVQAQDRLPPGTLKPSRNRQEWMRQVVTFSAEAARLVLQSKDAVSSPHSAALLARYGSALQLDLARLTQLFAVVGREIGQVVTSLNLMPNVQDPGASGLRAPSTLPNALKLATMATHTVLTSARHDSGKPLNARDLLLDGIQAATQMMGSSNVKPSALILLVVETLYISMGFRFAAACVRDVRSNSYRAIVTMGERHVERQTRFCFPLASSSDIFHLAMENNADLMIEDVSSTSIRDLLPDWHKQLLPDTRSIMLLPLVQGKNQYGVFYADRCQPASDGISSDEAALIKTLIGQMMTAICPRGAK